ncbi:MAG: redoxin domain-containing protein [Gammaproteobacteria bacterium]|nr:MAG: redoxin domain-containing protein [Gammaproteobacteria bacterium]
MTGKQIPAPEFPQSLEWFNTDKPVNLEACLGKVVLLNFSTYCSLQCINRLQDLEFLKNKYHDNVRIIGIHIPRFPGERTTIHLQKAIARHNIEHPIINDMNQRVTKLFGIRQPHALVVIDTKGNIKGATSRLDKRHKLDKITGQLLCKTDRHVAVPDTPDPSRECGIAANALAYPGRIHVTNKRVFIADSGNNRIIETTTGGHVLHQFGSSDAGFIDGHGTDAAFSNPQGMLLLDEYLYVADSGNHAIRRIHLQSDEVITIAGTGKPGNPPQSSHFSNPREVNLNAPCGLALKGNNIYIAMSGTNQIWALSLLTNIMEVIAGSGDKDLVDGISHLASFAQPSALSIMGNTLYVADAESSAIRAVDLDTRNVRTLVGGGLRNYGYNDGFATDAKLQYPLDLDADQRKKLLWVADTYNNKIRKIELGNNLVSSVTVDYPLHQPAGLAFSEDTLYIANTNLHEIVRIDLRNGNSDTLNVDDEYAGI